MKMINAVYIFFAKNFFRSCVAKAMWPVALVAALFCVASPAYAAIQFQKSSILRSDRWVKVGVEDSGIYEISYELLRTMGFPNPERVGVYGRGGAQLNRNFANLSKVPLYSDKLEQVPVMHLNGKIYFYGQGVTSFDLVNSTSYETNGYFKRNSINCYTTKGYYFLSDRESPLTMTEIVAGDLNTLTEQNWGVGRYYHEKELCHNNTNTGQLFLGEKVGPDRPYYNWEVNLPGALLNSGGCMELHYYVDRNVTGKFSFGIEGSPTVAEGEIHTYASTAFKTQNPTLVACEIPGPDSYAFMKVDTEDYVDISHVDFFIISYQKEIPSLRGKNGEKLNQDFVSFPMVTSRKPLKIRIPNGATRYCIDVSDPAKPKRVELKPDGMDAYARVSNVSGFPQYLIFDPYMPQKQVKCYEGDFEAITNQDLHAKAAEGADFIIICIPQLRDCAERLADVHRTKNNLKVLVATPDEIYNEFSTGVPDAMAYRALIKMVYQSPVPCRSVMLMGPLFADFRGIISEKQPQEGIIAYQCDPMNQVRGAMNANDYLGMMDDYLTYEELEKNDLHVAVSVLPVRYPAEANTFIDKIEDYLDFEDFAYYLNRIDNVGGVGDDHTHDNQATDIAAHISDLTNGAVVHTNLIIDAYGFGNARRKFHNTLNEGRTFINYFGHGGPLQLNQYGDFFNAYEVYKLRNKFLPVFNFAGCEITEPDKGVRGLGESLICSTPYGGISSIVATRQTWSGQNYDFFQTLQTCLYRTGATMSSPRPGKGITLGDALVRTKNQSRVANELAYQLLGDPNLVIPAPLRQIVVDTYDVPVPEDEYGTPTLSGLEGNPGAKVKVSGYVTIANTKDIDTEYNGTAVLRLMEPAVLLKSPDLIEGGTKPFYINYADTQVTMTACEVKNGKFEAELYLPTSTDNLSGQLCRLHTAAYDPAVRCGAGALTPVLISYKGNSTPGYADKKAPVIEEFSYDAASASLFARVSDDNALAFTHNPLSPAFRLYIDGREFAPAASILPKAEGSGAYTKTIPVYDIHTGTHAARVEVYDAEGNAATSEIVFTYDPNAGRFSIALENGVVDADGGKFTINGECPASADIVILDANGTLVRREPIGAQGYEWDGLSLTGQRVTPGIYKAYLIETGKSSRKGHSATITVPVI